MNEGPGIQNASVECLVEVSGNRNDEICPVEHLANATSFGIADHRVLMGNQEVHIEEFGGKLDCGSPSPGQLLGELGYERVVRRAWQVNEALEKVVDDIDGPDGTVRSEERSVTQQGIVDPPLCRSA